MTIEKNKQKLNTDMYCYSHVDNSPNLFSKLHQTFLSVYSFIFFRSQ